MASSWVTPRTWVTSEVPPAATWNIHVRDNLSWIGNDAPACRIRKSTDQNITTATATAITFATGDVTEDTDPQGMHDPATNNSRVTVPTGMGGLYLMGGNVEWDAIATATTRITGIRLNGSAFLVREQVIPAAVANGVDQACSTIYRLAAGDYIELVVQHARGSDMLVKSTATRSPCLWATWLQN